MDDDLVEFNLDMGVELDLRPILAAGHPNVAIPKKELQSWLALHSSLLAAPTEPEEALDTSNASVWMSLRQMVCCSSIGWTLQRYKGNCTSSGRHWIKLSKKMSAAALASMA